MIWSMSPSIWTWQLKSKKVILERPKSLHIKNYKHNWIKKIQCETKNINGYKLERPPKLIYLQPIRGHLQIGMFSLVHPLLFKGSVEYVMSIDKESCMDWKLLSSTNRKASLFALTPSWLIAKHWCSSWLLVDQLWSKVYLNNSPLVTSFTGRILFMYVWWWNPVWIAKSHINPLSTRIFIQSILSLFFLLSLSLSFSLSLLLFLSFFLPLSSSLPYSLSFSFLFCPHVKQTFWI